MTPTISIRYPRAGVIQSLTGRDVAQAYNYPVGTYDGTGIKVGIIELGGGFGMTDVQNHARLHGYPTPRVTAIGVDGGKNSSDGPNGADGEVLLDIEVAASVAPGADFRVYFAPNTDTGFLDAIKQAGAECQVISISWGGPENNWPTKTMQAFDKVFADLRAKGVIVFVASGDTGSQDSGGDGKDHVDFPASSPNVIGCGGTQLVIATVGGRPTRKTEVVWDLNDRSSATGGGVSAVFPGRQVPDVAGNASPSTGYHTIVDGGDYVIGGTSAVAPLYAGLAALLLQALKGKKFDFLNTVVTNPQICFDITSGDNGTFRAGPGRDLNTGFGVVDGQKMLDVVTDAIPDPVPPTPPTTVTLNAGQVTELDYWAARASKRQTLPGYEADAVAAYLAARKGTKS